MQEAPTFSPLKDKHPVRLVSFIKLDLAVVNNVYIIVNKTWCHHLCILQHFWLFNAVNAPADSLYKGLVIGSVDDLFIVRL